MLQHVHCYSSKVVNFPGFTIVTDGFYNAAVATQLCNSCFLQGVHL